MHKLSRRKPNRRGTANKLSRVGAHYSTDLINDINARVDAMTNATYLQPPTPSLTTAQLLVQLQRKVTSMSTKSSDQIRQLSRIFGSGGINKELSPIEFQNKVAKLGIGLTTKQCNDLFTVIDSDRSGGVSLKEFITGIMPKEMTAEPWYEKRRRQMNTDSQNSKTARGGISSSMFRQTLSNAIPTRTPKMICNLIYARIVSLSKRPTDQLRRIRRIFASNGSGADVGKQLTATDLRNTLSKIEILLKDNEVQPLFEYFDDDRSGTIDINEFLKGVMPRDITSVNPWDKREAKVQQELSKQKQIKLNTTTKEVVSSFRTDALPNLSTKEIKFYLLEKINQYSKKPTDRIRKVSQIFKRGVNSSGTGNLKLQNGLKTPNELKFNIEKLGLTLTGIIVAYYANQSAEPHLVVVSIFIFITNKCILTILFLLPPLIL